MHEWIDAVVRVAHLLLGNPPSPQEFWALATVGALVLLGKMDWMGKAAGVTNRGLLRRLVCTVVGVTVGLAAAAAVILYLYPHFPSDTIRLALLIVLPIVAVAAVAVPVQMLVLHATYSGAAVMFVSSAIVAAMVVILAAAAADAIRGGRMDSKAMQRRIEAIENMSR